LLCSCLLSQGLQLAGKHLKEEEQHALLYQRLRVMPLRLLEQVLPWLVAVLSEEEAKEMLRNMRLAGSMHLCPLFSLHSVLSG
jgi:zinc finger-like protein